MVSRRETLGPGQQPVGVTGEGRNHGHHFPSIAMPAVDLMHCNRQVRFASQDGAAKFQHDYAVAGHASLRSTSADSCEAVCKAWSRSAMMSRGSSRPTDSRMSPSVIPIASRSLGETSAWVIDAG